LADRCTIAVDLGLGCQRPESGPCHVPRRVGAPSAKSQRKHRLSDCGGLVRELDRRVGFRTEGERPARSATTRRSEDRHLTVADRRRTVEL
jgi:hypothetical protein